MKPATELEVAFWAFIVMGSGSQSDSFAWLCLGAAVVVRALLTIKP